MGFKSRTNKIRPRPHQRTAIRDTLEVFKTNDRTQVHMACGSGKTFIAAWIAQKLRSRQILVLVPSLALIHQLVDAFSSVIPGDWNGAVVCGSKEVFCAEGKQQLTMLSSPREIKTFLRGSGAHIVFCTYQSSSKLKGACFDFAVFDEAHRTAGEKDKSFAFANSEVNVKISKRLFMTATPRMCTLIKNDTRRYNNMRNEAIYGPVAHVLSFKAAVAKGIICDYKIIISVQDMPLDHETCEPLQVAVYQAMKKFSLRKVITFHKTVSEAFNFTDNSENAFPRTVKLYHVNGKQRGGDRKNTMAAFSSDDRAIVSNAKCLTEGVDIPSVDLVVFAGKKTSIIEIAQAVGRAMRNDPNNPQKIWGHVFLPLFVEPGITDEEAIGNAYFGEIFRVLTAMSELDETLLADLMTGESLADRIQYIGSAVDPKKLSPLSIKKLEDLISVRIIRRAYLSGTTEERHRKSKDQLLALAKNGAHRPPSHASSMETRRLAMAVTDFTGKGEWYDQEFADELKKLAPDWFKESRHAGFKAQLLELARTGKPRPTVYSKNKDERSIASLLSRFMRSSELNYDQEFTDELKKLAPDWFKEKVT